MVFTTAITGMSTPRFPALLDAWKKKSSIFYVQWFQKVFIPVTSPCICLFQCALGVLCSLCCVLVCVLFCVFLSPGSPPLVFHSSICLLPFRDSAHLGPLSHHPIMPSCINCVCFLFFCLFGPDQAPTLFSSALWSVFVKHY